ncbi:MAG: acyltransferase [Acutalibacteraceae bacterium]|nr:acyltransferase [Acutalibacteraceae bacterium]
MTNLKKTNQTLHDAKKIKKTRNSNLEILRILSVIMIIAHHYALHGFDNVPYSFNKNVLEILVSGGKLGVDIFVMISGYYMLNSKFTLNKFLKLASQVITYSVGLYVLFIILGAKLTFDITYFTPIINDSYWFITCYVLLMFLTPFLNHFCKNINQKQHLSIIMVITLMFPISQLLLLTELKKYGTPLTIFILLYLIACYIRMYNDKIKGTAARHITVAVLVTLIYFIALVLLNHLASSINLGFAEELLTYIKSQNSILLLIISTELLIGFTKMKAHHISWVNILSSASFGVYLIHDSDTTRHHIFRYLLQTTTMTESNLLIPHALLAVLIIFCICVIIDLLRQVTVGKLLDFLIDRYTDKVVNKLKPPAIKLYTLLKNIFYKIYS